MQPPLTMQSTLSDCQWQKTEFQQSTTSNTKEQLQQLLFLRSHSLCTVNTYLIHIYVSFKQCSTFKWPRTHLSCSILQLNKLFVPFRHFLWHTHTHNALSDVKVTYCSIYHQYDKLTATGINVRGCRMICHTDWSKAPHNHLSMWLAYTSPPEILFT